MASGRPLTRSSLVQWVPQVIGVEGEFPRRLSLSTELQWVSHLWDFAVQIADSGGSFDLSGATTTMFAAQVVPAGEIWLVELLAIGSTTGGTLMEMRRGGTGSRDQAIPLERNPVAGENLLKRHAQLDRPLLMAGPNIFGSSLADSWGASGTANPADTAIRYYSRRRVIYVATP